MSWAWTQPGLEAVGRGGSRALVPRIVDVCSLVAKLLTIALVEVEGLLPFAVVGKRVRLACICGGVEGAVAGVVEALRAEREC